MQVLKQQQTAVVGFAFHVSLIHKEYGVRLNLPLPLPDLCHMSPQTFLEKLPAETAQTS